MKTIHYLAGFAALLILFSCDEVKVEAYSKQAFTVPDDWFIQVDGTRETPAPDEGAESVFAYNPDNMDFHKWSWQKFLWLTNEVDEVPLFLSSLKQVDGSTGQPVNDGEKVILIENFQASGSADSLVSNASFSSVGKSYEVYYTVHVNDAMYTTMLTYAPMAQADLNSIKEKTFPVGALEVKCSWVDARALKDTTGYFITAGQMDATQQDIRVALLGMHVVGRVQNHPEFIWATFEHKELAPYFNWQTASETEDAIVNTDKEYLFFKAGDTATWKNVTSGKETFTNIFSVYKYGVPVKKEGDSVMYMATSEKGMENYNNIDTINTQVSQKLTDVWNNYFYNGSIWLNTEKYPTEKDQIFLMDSLGAHMSYSKPNDFTRGSVSTYNITMESYVQLTFYDDYAHDFVKGVPVDSIVNCFYCHGAVGRQNVSSPLFVSHTFSGFLEYLDGKSKPAIKEKMLRKSLKMYIE